MKTVIEMAREANRYADTHADSTDCDWPIVRDERFAELVRADERARMAEQPAQQEPAGWRPATFHRDNLTFNPGLPDEQTVKFWKLQGVEIEYCYTTPQLAQRTWAGLTDEEIAQGCKESWVTEQAWQSAVWWAEVKLKDKNNG